MTRWILAGLAAVVALPILIGTGCQSTGIGDPCTPEEEYHTDYLGAQVTEVKAESKSYQCQSFLCLVNHFQGRVTCPYGQVSFDDGGASNLQPCQTPIGQAVTGTLDGGPGDPSNPATFVDSVNKDTVAPNCENRPADNSVYCSCRCQNEEGKTDDGANYCTCPDGFQCQQLISSIGGASFQGLTGAYCIKSNTNFNANSFQCTQCNAADPKCGSAQGVTAK
jgi:hypothetical protein